MRYEDMKPKDFSEVPDEAVAVVTSWGEVPQFASEAEARAFWDIHILADPLWSQKRSFSPAGDRYLATNPERRRVRKIA